MEGDSAFGFSGMELETAARYKLPITFIIVNNNGIYQGLEELEGEPDYFPPTALKPRAHYEEVHNSPHLPSLSSAGSLLYPLVAVVVMVAVVVVVAASLSDKQGVWWPRLVRVGA